MELLQIKKKISQTIAILIIVSFIFACDDATTTTSNTTQERDNSTDTLPPSVVSYTPSNQASNIPLDTTIIFNFNEAIANLLFKNIDTNFNFDFKHSINKLIINPTDLSYGTPYALTLNGVSDMAGNVMPDFTTMFTTLTNQKPIDSTPPQVTKPNPEHQDETIEEYSAVHTAEPEETNDTPIE